MCAETASSVDQTSDEIKIHFNQDSVSQKVARRCTAGKSSQILADESLTWGCEGGGVTLREPLNLMWLDSRCWGDQNSS